MGKHDFRVLWFDEEFYTISEDSTILRGLIELRLVNQRW